jgi:hypothetical protein
MLLIIFLGLIAKSASVSSDCNFGTLKLKDFKWNKVIICVLTPFQELAAVLTADAFNILFLVPLTNCQ